MAYWETYFAQLEHRISPFFLFSSGAITQEKIFQKFVNILYLQAKMNKKNRTLNCSIFPSPRDNNFSFLLFGLKCHLYSCRGKRFFELFFRKLYRVIVMLYRDRRIRMCSSYPHVF